MTDQTFPCAGCGATIKERRNRKSRLCAACNRQALGSDPVRRERNREATRARCADPERRARMAKNVSAGRRAALASDPAAMERARELGRRVGRSRTMSAKHPAGSPARMKAGRSTAETKLRWCPREYRAEYRRLILSKKFPAAEARAIIEASIAKAKAKAAGLAAQAAEAERRARRGLEAQMEAVRRGAAVVPRFRAVAAMPEVTLGGVGTGML